MMLVSRRLTIHVNERQVGDRRRLAEAIRRERDASRRDRLRAVLPALDGGGAEVIADRLGRSRRSVQGWVCRYRDGGIEHIHPPRRPGPAPRLPREREAGFKARLDAGPRPDDGVCTLCGRDIARILEREFGVKYTLDGVHDLLERLGHRCPAPRPRHEKHDPEAQHKFKEESATLLCGPRRSRAACAASASACSSWTRPAACSKAR